jgi:predicted DNA-binding transcriptional regulator AlpA
MLTIQSSERLLTLDEVADYHGVDRMTVYYRLLSVNTSCPRVRVAVHRLQFLRPNVRINLRRHDRRMPEQRLNRS